MKTKILMKNKFGVPIQVKITFGNEIFEATCYQKYPNLGKWYLHRYDPTFALPFMRAFFPCGGKFKSLSHVKKWIRDRKYL